MAQLPRQYYREDGSRKPLSERQAERAEQDRQRREQEREQQRAAFDPFALSPAELQQELNRKAAAERRAELTGRESAKKDIDAKRRAAEQQQRAEQARENPYAYRLRCAEENGERLNPKRQRELKQLSKRRDEQNRAAQEAETRSRELLESEPFQLASRHLQSIRDLASRYGDDSTSQAIGALEAYLEAGEFDLYWSNNQQVADSLLAKMNDSLGIKREAFVQAGDDLHATEAATKEAAEILKETDGRRN